MGTVNRRQERRYDWRRKDKVAYDLYIRVISDDMMYAWEDEDISDLAGGPCKQSALINFRFLLYVVSLSPSLPSPQWTRLSLHGQPSPMIKTLSRKGQRNLAIVIRPFNSLL